MTPSKQRRPSSTRNSRARGAPPSAKAAPGAREKLPLDAVGALLKDAVLAAGEGILVVDAKMRILTANVEARRMWNYRESALAGLPLSRLFPERLRAGLSRALKAGGDEAPVESVGVRRDGTAFPVELRARETREGTRRFFTIHARDLSQYKITESALLDKSQLLGLMAEQMPAVLWTTDAELRFTSSLGAALAHISSYPNRVMGQTLAEVIGADDAKHPVIAAHRRALRGEGASYDYEWKGRSFRCRVEPLRDAKGRAAGVVGIAFDMTDALRAEETISRFEEMFHGFFENSAIGMYRTTPDGRILMANPAFARMLGFRSAEELMRSDFNALSAEADYDRTVFVKAMEKEGRVDGMEYSWRRPDGGVIHARESARAVRDAKGKILHYEGTVENITGRKKAEEALDESERRFRMLFAHNPHPMWVYDMETLAFMEVNHAAVERYGYSREEFLSMKVADIRPKEDVPKLLESLRGRRGNIQHSGVWRHMCKDGSLMDVEIISHALTFEGKKAALVVARDVTERLRAESALRESQRAMATLLSNLPGIAYRCLNDPTWTMEFMSEGCRELTGYAPEDFRPGGKITYADIIHPGDRDKVWEDVQAALKKKHPFHLLYRIVTAKGEERWVWEQGQGVWNADGSLVALEGFITDITARKAAEDEARLREESMRLHQAALVELGRHAVAAKDDPAVMLRRLTETAARTLGVERASVWLFTEDRAAVECLDLYEHGPARHSEDMALSVSDYPAYFAALEESRVIAAHDAHGDPRTDEFAKRYLTPFGITSMLDAPFRLGGKVAGVVCHEHVGPKRTWTAEEQNFAGSIADLAALLLEGQERDKLRAAFETSEGRYRALVENAPFCVHTTDLEGRITSINAAGVASLGAADERDILGKSQFDFVEELDLPSVRALFERAKCGETVSYEFTLILPDGAKRLAATLVPLRDGAGRVVQMMGVARDVTEQRSLETMLKASYEQVLHWSQHDALTGLLNQSHIQKAMSEEIRRSQEKGVPFAFLFVDLDRFKRINEMYGHLTGDRYLRHVSGVLQAFTGETAFAARVGGDQFGVLLPGAGEGSAAEFCAAMLEKFRRSPLMLPQEHLRLTASVGVAVFPKHGQTVAEILAQAERAMEEVKIGSLEKGTGGTGGDGYKISGSAAPSRVSPALLHKDRIVTEALREGRLVAAYQAIRHLPTNRDVLWEALVRIVAADGTVLEPSEFLFDALRHGQSSAIDLAVVSHGLETLSRLRNEGGHGNIAFTFNIAPTSLQDPEFFGAVAAKMHACGVQPRQIVFEFSENALLADIHPVLPVIESLHRSGIRFAIDDFGAGATSLRHLIGLPLSFIKIDGVYIRALPRDPRARILVESIVTMAKKLGVEVIAEWVENEECLRAVRELGIDYVQGFLLSQPRLDPWPLARVEAPPLPVPDGVN